MPTVFSRRFTPCRGAGMGLVVRTMIGRLNHVAIAVPDLAAAAAQYRDTLGARVGAPQDEPEHGVTVVFVELPNTKVELLHPLGRGLADRGVPGEESVGRDPPHLLRGRGHLGGARPAAGEGRAGARGRRPKIGAHGKPVLFLHPKDFAGTLVELEEA